MSMFLKYVWKHKILNSHYHPEKEGTEPLALTEEQLLFCLVLVTAKTG